MDTPLIFNISWATRDLAFLSTSFWNWLRAHSFDDFYFLPFLLHDASNFPSILINKKRKWTSVNKLWEKFWWKKRKRKNVFGFSFLMKTHRKRFDLIPQARLGWSYFFRWNFFRPIAGAFFHANPRAVFSSRSGTESLRTTTAREKSLRGQKTLFYVRAKKNHRKINNKTSWCENETRQRLLSH